MSNLDGGYNFIMNHYLLHIYIDMAKVDEDYLKMLLVLSLDSATLQETS